ncbi:hypothetical protein ID47_09175 [Candidatus Paracaedibacter acanthamoebae]|uniref:Uncharacterized protein n=1 Tax=Candidatus Odyssella acanthamoebae TaxID=91604 RepID=A0A077AXX9_9PROT|nr:hypothetical protein ID47_09175 [Candidatus Paracaedibacter acanthamoebae]
MPTHRLVGFNQRRLSPSIRIAQEQYLQRGLIGKKWWYILPGDSAFIRGSLKGGKLCYCVKFYALSVRAIGEPQIKQGVLWLGRQKRQPPPLITYKAEFKRGYSTP